MTLHQFERRYRLLLKDLPYQTCAIEKGIAGATCGLRESNRFAKAAIPSPTSASRKPQAMSLSTTVRRNILSLSTSNTMRFVPALLLVPLGQMLRLVGVFSRDGLRQPFLSTIRDRTCYLTSSSSSYQEK